MNDNTHVLHSGLRILAFVALAIVVAPAADAQSCGCYELRELCGKVGGVSKTFASYGQYCVIDGQSADNVGTLSYRMQDFPADCEMFDKKLASNLGQRIKDRGLECSKTGLPACSATSSGMCITQVSGYSRLSGDGGSSTLHCDVDRGALLSEKPDTPNASGCMSICNDNPLCTGFNYTERFKNCTFFNYRSADDQAKVPCYTKGTNARPHYDLQYFFNDSRL